MLVWGNWLCPVGGVAQGQGSPRVWLWGVGDPRVGAPHPLSLWLAECLPCLAQKGPWQLLMGPPFLPAELGGGYCAFQGTEQRLFGEITSSGVEGSPKTETPGTPSSESGFCPLTQARG